MKYFTIEAYFETFRKRFVDLVNINRFSIFRFLPTILRRYGRRIFIKEGILEQIDESCCNEFKQILHLSLFVCLFIDC